MRVRAHVYNLIYTCALTPKLVFGMEFGNALGATVSGLFGLAGSAQQFKYAKELAEQQNQYNIDMWKMQADYNSPQAQMRRFQKAGLNPNLIYGQGSNGNMSQPPVQTVPAPPEISEHMARIGQAFNIEGLRTTVANRKKAEAEAEIAKVNAEREKDHYVADQSFGQEYDFNPATGQFVPYVPTMDNVTVYKRPAARYYKLMHLSDNYRTNSLLVPRANLMSAQHQYLQPQIQMLKYEQRFQPWSFWIGQGTKVMNSLPLPKFSFGRGRKDNYYHFNQPFNY